MTFEKMSDSDLLAYCGDDAAKWAEAFCATAARLGYGEIDEGWMIGWFANAIEHSSDIRNGTGPAILPDGTAVFMATL